MTNEIPMVLSDIIFAAADEVFSSMLTYNIRLGKNVLSSQELPNHGVIAVVGLTGDWIGSGYLSCSGPTAILLASRFLTTEVDCLNDEVLDVLGELANMIVGSVKNNLEEHLGSMQLSIPTVIYGKNIRSRLMKSEITQTVTCCGDDWEVLLRICLSQNANFSRGTTRSAPLTIGHR